MGYPRRGATDHILKPPAAGVCWRRLTERYTGGPLADTETAQVQQLRAEREAQRSQPKDLSNKLRAAAKAHSSVKALRAAMPEFAKYLPEADKAPDRSLPVVANVVSEFTKAGWPKGDQK